jgi:hypothetical protein
MNPCEYPMVELSFRDDNEASARARSLQFTGWEGLYQSGAAAVMPVRLQSYPQGPAPPAVQIIHDSHPT